MTLFAELGMRYPVIQAPMAGVQDSALAMAATSAVAICAGVSVASTVSCTRFPAR